MKYLFLLAILVMPSFGWAQELSSEEEKELQALQTRRRAQRLEIDAEIQKADDQKTSGFIKIAAGTVIEIGAALAFFPGVELRADEQGNLTTYRTGNAPLFYGGMLLGSAVTLWGVYQVIDGYATVTLLRNKRYSIDLGAVPQGGYLAVRF